MNWTKKGIIWIIVLGMICILLLSYILTSEVVKEENKYIPYIGKRVILTHDTLEITDYSIIGRDFTLSNGVKVDYEWIKHAEIFNDSSSSPIDLHFIKIRR